jgi:hydroxymethylpyrimidine pyrophosphatase-like HAD family hydrolase
MIIAIDFDGTIVDHQYPDIGQPVPGALEAIREIKQRGHRVMLWTMRSGEPLRQAFDYCKNHGVNFTSEWTNQNPEQHSWTNSNKQYANFYIDDAAIGCPLREHPSALSKRECVDWAKVMEILRTKPGF